MEPNEPVTDKSTETPEQDQGVQIGDAAPLESEPGLESTEEKPHADDSALSIEERNIRNSPNIAAPTTGPTEEELAEQKHKEEMAKLDELKPLVNETLIDNGSSMERKKRRPLVIIFAIVVVAVIAGIAGVLLFTNKKQPTKDIKGPTVIHYTEEVKVGIDSRVKAAFSEVADSISNFKKITASTPENNIFSTDLIVDKKYDLLITTNYEMDLVDPGEDPTYVPVTMTPFLNDAVVLLVNKDLPLTSIRSADVSRLYGGRIADWSEVDGINYSEEQAGEHAIKYYYTEDIELAADISEYVVSLPKQFKQEEKVEDLATVVSKVAEDANGIAFVRLSDLTTDMMNSVKMLDVNSVTPGNDKISDASYKYTIEYYIVNLQHLEGDSVPAAYRDTLIEKAANASNMKKALQPFASTRVEACETDEVYDEELRDCVRATE